MDKYTLIPSAFFRSDKAAETLAEFFAPVPSEEVKYTELPHYKAVLVFAVPRGAREGYMPVAHDLLQMLPLIREHNKVVASFIPGELHIAVAEGDRLLMCNSFEAADFVTAQYFIFAAIKQFQFNPEMTTLYFREKLDVERQETLLEYFHGVENISVLYNI